jgi:DNA helicase HerA-like ATPase
MLSELFEVLPEVGDPDKPKLVFFFDEAHLLFDDAPKGLLDKIEQVVRLIRSKGVGVYFITQNPIDIPDDVAGQLGNRVQHALRAFTPRDQKAVQSAADTFRANPGVNVATVITELKVGEALVSLLQADGAPSPVQRSLIKPPGSRVGPLTAQERGVIVSTSPIAGKYDTAINRESAQEVLAAKANASVAAAAKAKADAEAAKTQAEAEKVAAKQQAEQAKIDAKAQADAARQAAQPGMFDKAIQSATRAASSSIGRQVANEIGREVFGSGSRRSSSSSGGLGSIGGTIVRGILGSLFRGR